MSRISFGMSPEFCIEEYLKRFGRQGDRHDRNWSWYAVAMDARERYKQILKTALQVLLLLGVVALAFYLARLAKESETVQGLVSHYGYAGIFVVALLSGFNFVFPIPAAAFMPLFVVSGADFWLAILLIAIGGTLADSVAYALGRVGHRFVSYSTNRRVLETFETLRMRYPSLPLVILFLFAALLPLPNELLLVPIGLLGYRFSVVLPIVFAGNLLFNLLYSTGAIQLFNTLYA